MKPSADLPHFQWSQPSKVVLFPAARRRAFIFRTARRAAAMKPAGATNLIRHLVDRHRARLVRLSIEADVAEADARALETAIFVEIAHLRGGGA